VEGNASSCAACGLAIQAPQATKRAGKSNTLKNVLIVIFCVIGMLIGLEIGLADFLQIFPETLYDSVQKLLDRMFAPLFS